RGSIMNTMGKTLVIINFVFALLTGAFLLIDFGTRSNWKEAYEKAKAQLEIARLNVGDYHDTTKAEIGRAKVAETSLELFKKKQAELTAESRAKETELKQKLKEAETKADVAVANYTSAVAELKRRAEEVARLTDVMKQRDTMILQLQKEKTKYLNEAV